jgi:hypothetical protein
MQPRPGAGASSPLAATQRGVGVGVGAQPVSLLSPTSPLTSQSQMQTTAVPQPVRVTKPAGQIIEVGVAADPNP